MLSMTSAQSHLLRLSGNKQYYFIVPVLLILCFGCASVKKGTKSASTDAPDRELPQVYNPETGEYEPVENPLDLVDTIEFIEDLTIPPVEETEEVVFVKKDEYELTLLVPFQASRISEYTSGIDPRLRRFVHYYAGVRMALRELNLRGIRLKTNVYDTRETSERTEELLGGMKRPDLIIGPYQIESLKHAEEYARKHRVPLFSPWTPSIPVERSNPYFVQLLPGLDAHAKAIVEYIDENLPDSRVYLTARNDPRETGRFSLYQEPHLERDGAIPYHEFIIEDSTVALIDTPLDGMLSEDTSTVFILPHYSRRDEDFIASLLRKLHAEKGESEVYVFGLPQWPSFQKLRPDYLESTNVHISSSFYVDYSSPEIRAFQQEFLDIYGTIPEQSAFQGYTLVKYLGEALFQFGPGFLEHLSQPEASNDFFRIIPTYESEDTELRRQRVRIYENTAIHILRFVDQKFRPAGIR